ncbi:putative F-box domain-containing protein [Helianthus annuus]|uniref:F-box/kelch-repeat protein At3g23880 n=1 Tax=Helianthus annuus TaxID=4232 RepID=UPI000B9083A3|nr:F-box/kelch-repeat protein At3g23880 [Helianthus annuus]KAJ0451716.1 putative F-box domain-containing protein [Helianthus annuus]KAJ0456369.1 putative F-box domain-containing protein [Helianthus annuus]KAJ0473601.1 putative F-box domain-containing protein [Helianthus annuus]KAJ0649179.1 putative F-box domain-containing protein [Helianthus annuus]KAJ0652982.1 putative F-box domain-containing protein [Helianthus annuus]
MPDNIPFEIQTEIMKRLPVKSLLRFRSVSKSCKSLIDSSDFIKHYIGQQQQHLLVRCYDCVAHFEKQSMSIVDDDSLPTQTASVTLPSLVEYPNLIGTSHGLFCFYGPSSRRAVIFNPCIRTTLAFAVPRVTNDHLYQTVIGFGVCRHTADPKIVKITLTKKSDRHINSPWQVEVFTVSTSTWRSAYSTNLPRNSISIYMNQVVVDGCLYWLAIDGCSYLIVSFDLTSEEFREVNLPDSLAQFRGSLALSLYKLRESLAVIKDGVEANKRVYHVWMMHDDSFIKLYTINSSHSPDVSILRVCGFRKTGQPLIELSEAHPGSTSILAAYDPYSKSITYIRNDGNYSSYTVHSYMETLLLL